jgi:hypothetical protein
MFVMIAKKASILTQRLHNKKGQMGNLPPLQ